MVKQQDKTVNDFITFVKKVGILAAAFGAAAYAVSEVAERTADVAEQSKKIKKDLKLYYNDGKRSFQKKSAGKSAAKKK